MGESASTFLKWKKKVPTQAKCHPGCKENEINRYRSIKLYGSYCFSVPRLRRRTHRWVNIFQRRSILSRTILLGSRGSHNNNQRFYDLSRQLGDESNGCFVPAEVSSSASFLSASSTSLSVERLPGLSARSFSSRHLSFARRKSGSGKSCGRQKSDEIIAQGVKTVGSSNFPGRRRCHSGCW